MNIQALSAFPSDQLLEEVIRRKNQAEADIEAGRKAFQLLRTMTTTPLVMEKVINAACDFFGCTQKDILDRTRHADKVKVRHCVIYAAFARYGLGRCELGRYFNQDHATIHHAIKAMQVKAEKYPTFKAELDSFLATLK